MDQIPVEGVIVAKAEAGAEPVAVMIELEHASLANGAMVAARRLPYLTCATEGQTGQVRRDALIHEEDFLVEAPFRVPLFLLPRYHEVLACHIVWPYASRYNTWICHGAPHHVVVSCGVEVDQNDD